MRALHRRAAEELFTSRNKLLPQKNMLDLHGLHVNEALEYLGSKASPYPLLYFFEVLIIALFYSLLAFYYPLIYIFIVDDFFTAWFSLCWWKISNTEVFVNRMHSSKQHVCFIITGTGHHSSHKHLYYSHAVSDVRLVLCVYIPTELYRLLIQFLCVCILLPTSRYRNFLEYWNNYRKIIGIINNSRLMLG